MGQGKLVVVREVSGACEVRWYGVESRHDVQRMIDAARKKLVHSLARGFHVDVEVEEPNLDKIASKEDKSCQKEKVKKPEVVEKKAAVKRT